MSMPAKNTSRLGRRRAAGGMFAAAVLMVWGALPAFAGDREDVRAADLRRIHALIHADQSELAAVLADELAYGHSDGRVQGKPELIAALKSGVVTYQSYDGPAPTVRIQENTAILSGVAEIDATAGGVKAKLWLRYLAVYVKQDGAWRLTAYQSTRLDQPPTGLR